MWDSIVKDVMIFAVFSSITRLLPMSFLSRFVLACYKIFSTIVPQISIEEGSRGSNDTCHVCANNG